MNQKPKTTKNKLVSCNPILNNTLQWVSSNRMTKNIAVVNGAYTSLRKMELVRNPESFKKIKSENTTLKNVALDVGRQKITT